MDSHAFSEPELVPPREQEAGGETPRLLTWRVHVLRNGVADPVDTLLVNARTLPPRTNRAGKIVWRLPDDPSHVPKFGVHEQKRLWDLFKEQKKQRRKDKLSLSGRTDDANSNSNSNPTGGGEADDGGHGEGDSSTLSGGAERGEASGGTPQSSLGNQREETADTSRAVNGHSTPVSPPPGFGGTAGIETLTIQETHKRRVDTYVPVKPLPASPPTINPPPGLTSAASASLTSSPASLNGHHSLYGDGAPTLSTVTSAQPPTGGTVPSAHPRSPQRSSYFSLPPAVDVSPEFPQSLAGRVAHTFQTLISVSGSPHGVSEWLSYYAPAAQSTLIMGTAQAVALTHDELRTQWQGLSASSDVGPTGDADGVGANAAVGGKRWECRGWTAQWVDRGATDVATVAKWPNDVLVVLSGRTLQQHLLSFHLTLLLQHQHMPQGSQPSRPAYQISNEILALALLT